VPTSLTYGDADTDADADSDSDADADADSDADADDTGATGYYDHSPIDPNTTCMSCHEVDRKDSAHYTDPDPLRTWDCGPCHGYVDWLSSYEHPIRTPHGTYSVGTPIETETLWVVACTSCHPVSLLEYDCNSCHLPIFDELPIGHYGLTVADATSNAACTEACHPVGD
jgi:hypothetical protein